MRPRNTEPAIHATTIVARNYLAYARVLALSFLEHHPAARFTTLVIDRDDGAGDPRSSPPPRAGATRELTPAELRVNHSEWRQMAGIYDVMEFATAIKPALMLSLLEEEEEVDSQRESPVICYLDPDIRVYRALDEALAAANAGGVALTPHVLHPLPRDGREPSERMLMHAGLFNLGFIAVGVQGRPFLEWWHDRTRREARVDLSNALFTDQRWVDWVPSLFRHVVLRDHGLNVAYWNLHERPLIRDSQGELLAAGAPLRFFHFSGYDVGEPWRLSRHAGATPRCLLSEHPIAADLCRAYGDELLAAGHETQRRIPYGLARAKSGVRLTRLVRSTFRDGLLLAEAAGQSAPPSPFDPDGGDAFASWLTEPHVGPRAARIGRLHHRLWQERPDLQAAFPDLHGVDAMHFAAWLDVDPAALEVERDSGLERLGRNAWARTSLPSRARGGWNVVGYHSAELGVGEAGRRLATAIEHIGLPVEYVGASAPTSREEHPLGRRISPHLRYRDSLFAVNADQLARVVALVDSAGGERGQRLGLWFWEVDVFPERWHGAFDLVDEVWCASPFCAQAVEQISPVPVRLIPLPVVPPGAPTPYTRDLMWWPPDRFTFLFVYDFNSVFARKNPLELIDAFTRAFGPNDGAALVLKSINGHRDLIALEQLRHAAGERPDVIIIDGYRTPTEMQAMTELADCFVSLHRSEGFGFNMAKAMAVGTPVIATGYSGNMAFMDETSAFLVPYELVPVGPGHDPYPPQARWAQPDIDAAASLMRSVLSDPAAAAARAATGRRAILERFSLARAAEVLSPLLSAEMSMASTR
jgi:glycosyltransferase involved in cell wall biosynthesis